MKIYFSHADTFDIYHVLMSLFIRPAHTKKCGSNWSHENTTNTNGSNASFWPINMPGKWLTCFWIFMRYYSYPGAIQCTEWGLKPLLRIKMHPFSLRRTLVSFSSFYLSVFLSNFFRFLVTQFERDQAHSLRESFRLILYGIRKRGQLWLLTWIC